MNRPAGMRLALLAAIAAGGRPAAAFGPAPPPLAGQHTATAAARTAVATAALRRIRRPALRALPGEPDFDDEDYNEDYDEDDDDDEAGLESLMNKKLGINIGSQLPSLSPEEIADIKAAAQKTLDAAVDSRLADIEELREQLQEDLAESRSRMEVAAKLNVQLEKQNLMEKIDRISNDFLNKDKDFRESTKRAADADKVAGSMGRGVDWGSWGNVGEGEVVIASEGVGRGGASRLLGSVDAARRRGERLSSAEEEGEEVEVVMEAENRVLVVVDDKKDKGAAPILARLSALLHDAFDSDIRIDTYSPSGNVPLGGNDAPTAIIFASSLNDRTSLENLLGRILKRTAPVAGGKVGMPPSHVVIVSALGTERTNKMPYSMQNLFGGKLDKLREIEEAMAAVSKSRIPGKQNPLDYTVVKFGEVAGEDAAEAAVAIRPGDQLDGEIGPNAAAHVLLQAMAYQPYARNATLCATGSLPVDAAVDEAEWNDQFLRLSGPELLRVEAGRGAAATDDGLLDTKYEQLAQYVGQWAGQYEGDRKGTGLTTPVLVRQSRRPASDVDGVVARSGVRILFQTTNTGDRYKSASEEKVEERERSGGGTPKKTSSTVPVAAKARKEGGVEALVEKTTDGSLRVRARRCNMDDKTIVKEMSEEVIVKSLKKAVEAWANARAVTGF